VDSNAPVRPGSAVVWFRSLYWRILLGLTLLIAVLVLAQAGAVLWLLNRGESAADRLSGVTQSAAWQLGQAMTAGAHVDIAAFLKQASPGDRLFVITRDGRVAGANPGAELTGQVITDLSRPNLRNVPVTWQRSRYRAASVFVNDQFVAIVGVVPPTAIQRYGPAVALVVVIVMFGGAILGAGFIIGPLRRRLWDLTNAAHCIGGGDFTARARQDGADEVTALASAFNLMADELIARTRSLEASNSARRQLLADVSHELMTPVTAIRGYLETLAMPEVQLDAQTRARHVAVARRETHRLERLIGDLLDTVRLEAGAAAMDLADVPVADLFERIVNRHEYECRARSIELTASVAPGAEEVVGDAFRLEQALTNVTANALRHSPDGGRIELRAERQGPSIVLAVSDSGEGISPEHLPLIFDRFYKASAAKAGTPAGSGLGLFIVKTIVERHGGRVWATSEVGRGTTIRIELPVHGEDREAADDRARPAAGLTAPPAA
jgi:signal transduction histidine kinase